MAQIGIDYQAFNLYNEEEKRGHCRLCGALSTGRFWHYCCKEHRDLFEMGTSWAYARDLVLVRDNFRCVKCGNVVASHYCAYDENKKTFVYSEEIANVHHIIPVAYLRGEIYKALEGCPEEDLDRRKEQLKAIVILHIDNLVTLCEKHHKETHKSGWYEKFKMRETGQKTLVEIFAE